MFDPNYDFINDSADIRGRVEAPVYQALVDFFFQGFAVLKAQVSEDIRRSIKKKIDAFLSQYPVKSQSDRTRIVNFHSDEPSVLTIFNRDSALNAFLHELMMGDPAIYTSLTFKYGTQQPLHRDTPVFWTSPPGKYAGVWIALEDANESNGALQVVRFSQNVPAVDPLRFLEQPGRRLRRVTASGSEIWPAYQDAEVQAATTTCRLKAESLPVDAGDVVIWHPQLLHGGGRTNPGLTRYSMVFHCTPLGTPVYQADKYFSSERYNLPETWGRTYIKSADGEMPYLQLGPAQLSG